MSETVLPVLPAEAQRRGVESEAAETSDSHEGTKALSPSEIETAFRMDALRAPLPAADLVGKIIEFQVTPALLSILANFVEYEAQVEPATPEDMATSLMLSRFLKRRRAAVRERVNTLLHHILTARVVPMDSDVNEAMFRLRESAGRPVSDHEARWIAQKAEATAV